MKFTFGIVTSSGEEPLGRVRNIVESISNMEIHDSLYEIVVVGGDGICGKNLVHIPFDESVKKAWITRKKNIITETAKFENIVYSHDYVSYDKDWYKGYIEFGNSFDVCMNKIVNFDGSRFADYCLDAMLDIENIFGDIKNQKLIDYDLIEKVDLTKIMYISGAYWVAKKAFMKKYPLDERLCWGQEEDVVWSHEARKYTSFKFNHMSISKLNKDKKMGYQPLSRKTRGQLLSITDEEIGLMNIYTSDRGRDLHDFLEG